jgi:hypothetical protein
MFMQPIEHPVLVRSRRRRLALKLVVGSLSILALAPIMALWWIAAAVWLPLAAVTRSVGSVARASYDIALFAGEAVVGR